MKSTFYSKILACLLGLLLTNACSSDSKISGDVKEKKLTDKSENANPMPVDPSGGTTTMIDGESVSIPGVITGAFLVCHIVESNKKVEVNVGCGFENSEAKRILIRAVAAKDVFSLKSTPPSGIIVTILPSDGVYDAYYNFSGKGFDELTSAAFAAQYSVELSDLTNGQASKTMGGTGSMIATPPEQRWSRENLSDLNADRLCNANEACLFKGNGLIWYRDLAVAKNFADAQNFCETLNSIYTGWRLPEQNEIRIAFEKNIASIAGADALNLADDFYWIRAASEPSYLTVNPRTAATAFAASGESRRSFCVRVAD